MLGEVERELGELNELVNFFFGYQGALRQTNPVTLQKLEQYLFRRMEHLVSQQEIWQKMIIRDTEMRLEQEALIDPRAPPRSPSPPCALPCTEAISPELPSRSGTSSRRA